MKEICILKNDSGQRTDKFLMKYFSRAPKSFIYKMLRKKRIKLNGKRAGGDEMLCEGDVLQMYLSDETMESFKEQKSPGLTDGQIDVVYEDKNIIAVNKPAGVLSHAESADDRDTLIDRILGYLYKNGEYLPEKENSFVPALCNRLDRNTSGIVVAGKNADALRQLNEAVKNKNIRKLYKTIVKGNISKPGKVENLYKKDKTNNRAIIGEGDKNAVTLYRPLKHNGDFTLAEVELITGRSHQIRAHMASISCPIIGDIKYGNKQINELFRKKAGIRRQLLHAYRVIFSGLKGDMEYLNGTTVSADAPEDFKRAEREIFGQ